jgi:predicted kinase
MSGNRGCHSTEDRTALDPAVFDGGDQQLVALCGLPGVGKSTVSRYIQDRLDARRLRTDRVRQEMFPDPTYSEEERRAVYHELCDRAEQYLAAGESVVLDATFASTGCRDTVREVAADHGIPFNLVRVVCEQSVAEQRIAERDDLSDADVTVYRQFKETFDPIECDHAVIDNSGSKENTRSQVSVLFDEP